MAVKNTPILFHFKFFNVCTGCFEKWSSVFVVKFFVHRKIFVLTFKLLALDNFISSLRTVIYGTALWERETVIICVLVRQEQLPG